MMPDNHRTVRDKAESTCHRFLSQAEELADAMNSISKPVDLNDREALVKAAPTYASRLPMARALCG